MKASKKKMRPVQISADLQDKVTSWFFNNLMVDGGYNRKMQHDEFLQIVNSCPICRNNNTVLQCMNQLNMRYAMNADYAEIRAALISCINAYKLYS